MVVRQREQHWLQFQSPVCWLLTVWLQASSLASMRLSFLICRMGIIKPVHAKSLQSCLTLYNPMLDYSPLGSSVPGILQARILEWIAMPSSGNLSDPGIEPTSLASPALADRFFTTSTTWEAPWYNLPLIIFVRPRWNQCSFSIRPWVLLDRYLFFFILLIIYLLSTYIEHLNLLQCTQDLKKTSMKVLSFLWRSSQSCVINHHNLMWRMFKWKQEGMPWEQREYYP